MEVLGWPALDQPEGPPIARSGSDQGLNLRMQLMLLKEERRLFRRKRRLCFLPSDVCYMPLPISKYIQHVYLTVPDKGATESSALALALAGSPRLNFVAVR